MVEFAITAILLLTILFFIIEFGQATWRYNTVAGLAKDAARYASVHGSSSGSVADSASVQTYVNSRSQGIPVIVHTTWPEAGSKAPGKRVQVQVETTFTPRTTLIPHSALNLHSTAQVIIAR